jgi:hypothetical protein
MQWCTHRTAYTATHGTPWALYNTLTHMLYNAHFITIPQVPFLVLNYYITNITNLASNGGPILSVTIPQYYFPNDHIRSTLTSIYHTPHTPNDILAQSHTCTIIYCTYLHNHTLYILAHYTNSTLHTTHHIQHHTATHVTSHSIYHHTAHNAHSTTIPQVYFLAHPSPAYTTHHTLLLHKTLAQCCIYVPKTTPKINFWNISW